LDVEHREKCRDVLIREIRKLLETHRGRADYVETNFKADFEL
jgi:hypothetical protein